jgi:ATP-dependent Clp protease ATP-binding subunit ClpC
MDGYNFTDRTRRALQAAGDDAAALGHEYIGTEHILLALLRDRESAAVGLLTRLGSDLEAIRTMIEQTVKKGTSAVPAGAQRPYTSRVKKVLELAMVCAREDTRSPVGTQHLLLRLLREEKGIAAQVLVHSGVTLSRATAALGDVAGTDEGTPTAH